MISIKRYLDAYRPAAEGGAPEPETPEPVALEAFRATLCAVGKSAMRACPAPGAGLEDQLGRLRARLAGHPESSEVLAVQVQAEQQLERWGKLTAEHLKGKADEVKELLLLLANTAESIGERDQRCSRQFGGLTAELQAIAGLDDLAEIRTTLVRKTAELKACVEKMTQEGKRSLSEMRSKVTVYETRLKAVEEIALRDSLTELANRRSAEGRMDWHMAQQHTYCVVMLDLDCFKAINDKYGHATGDNLLRMFSDELQKNTRMTDLVGRWGGDEFIVILQCDREHAQPQVERIRQWVLGKYTLETEKGPAQVDVQASIGVAQWVPGMTSKQVIAQADASMYLDKQKPREEAQKMTA